LYIERMNPLKSAINMVGGQASLARKITGWFERNGQPGRVIKQQHIWKWINHPSGVPTAPSEYRMAIQEITEGEITCIDLSHDIYD